MVNDHPNTPWALLAEKELKRADGLDVEGNDTPASTIPSARLRQRTTSSTTTFAERPPNEKAQMIQRPVKRPVPKL